jgi:hypothetical protein
MDSTQDLMDLEDLVLEEEDLHQIRDLEDLEEVVHLVLLPLEAPLDPLLPVASPDLPQALLSDHGVHMVIKVV